MTTTVHTTPGAEGYCAPPGWPADQGPPPASEGAEPCADRGVRRTPARTAENDRPTTLGKRTVGGAASGVAFGVGVGLTAPASIAESAMLVPAALVAVAALGAPALLVGLSLLDAKVGMREMAAAVASGFHGAGGAMLALAPVAGFYALTTPPGAVGASLVAGLGLALAGVVGMVGFAQDLLASERALGGTVRARTFFAVVAFAIFGAVLATRIWSQLPLFGGEV